MRTSVHNLLADQGHRCKGDRFMSGLLADLAYVRQGRSRCLWCCPGVVAVALGRPPCRARSGHDLQIRRSGAWRGGREPDHGRPSGAGLDRARQHGSSRIRPQVAAAPAAPPQAAADRATRGIVMRTGRMTAASAHGYIVVSRGQLWHRRPVRGIEAHLDPSFITEPPARIPTSPMIANGPLRGVARVGPAQTPATIPHSDRLGKEFRHRSSGLPVRVIRSEHGWMLLYVRGGGWPLTFLSRLLSAQPRSSGGKPTRTVEPPGPRTGSGAAV
jgi:hypothetical protein